MCFSTPFSSFPSELRIQVWNEALVNESDARLVVTYYPDVPNAGTHILPYAGLVSPLLSVSVESRQCALTFYSLRLPVCPLYKTLGLHLTTISPGSTGGRNSGAGPRYPSPEAIALSIQARRIGVAITAFQGIRRESLDLYTASGGVLYLNPQRDTFVYPYRSDIQLYGTKYYKTLHSEDDDGGEDKEASEDDNLLTPAFPETEYFERVASQVTRVLLVGGDGFALSEPWMEPGHLYAPYELRRFPNCFNVRYIKVKDPIEVLKPLLRTGRYKQPGVLGDARLSTWLPADDVRQRKVELPYPC